MNTNIIKPRQPQGLGVFLDVVMLSGVIAAGYLGKVFLMNVVVFLAWMRCLLVVSMTAVVLSKDQEEEAASLMADWTFKWAWFVDSAIGITFAGFGWFVTGAVWFIACNVVTTVLYQAKKNALAKLSPPDEEVPIPDDWEREGPGGMQPDAQFIEVDPATVMLNAELDKFKREGNDL